jgi:methionyl-tRNA formyltransferase
VVFAYSGVGHACLKKLIEKKENVVAVYTHLDRAGENIWFPSVANLAMENKIPVMTEENLSAAAEQDRIAALKADIIFSFYYRNLIPLNVLGLAKLGAFNMHGSFLPKYRGRAPVNWAVLNGETETGATLHVMTEKADAGDIVDQEKVTIGPDETAFVVQEKVTQAAVTILDRQLENLKKGSAPRIKQNVADATYFGRRGPQDGEILWSWPAQRVHNLVRALSHPYPGAFAMIAGQRCVIWQTRLREPGEGQVGELQESGGRAQVLCGDKKFIEIVRVQPQNKSEMSGLEFIRTHQLMREE